MYPYIKFFENENLLLQEKIDELATNTTISAKADKKMYSQSTRLKVFDCIVHHVSTKDTPELIKKFAERSGDSLDYVPHRNTVELMARELGVIAELQTAEMIMQNKNITIGFDATTQEGTHINSIHFTTKDR